MWGTSRRKDHPKLIALPRAANDLSPKTPREETTRPRMVFRI
jgi:hypothetical protein